MRPTTVAAILLLTLSACTIREESFAPTSGEPSSDGLSLAPPPDLNAPVEGEGSSCPGGFARGSDAQIYRDGSQDLFCD
jgi:hypothetical protein